MPNRRCPVVSPGFTMKKARVVAETFHLFSRRETRSDSFFNTHRAQSLTEFSFFPSLHRPLPFFFRYARYNRAHCECDGSIHGIYFARSCIKLHNLDSRKMDCRHGRLCYPTVDSVARIDLIRHASINRYGTPNEHSC